MPERILIPIRNTLAFIAVPVVLLLYCVAQLFLWLGMPTVSEAISVIADFIVDSLID